VTSLVGFDSDLESDTEQRFSRRLLGYLDAVASALGVGLESCAVDLDVPSSAYVALDGRFGWFPGRDVALTWDERHGWAAVVDAVGDEGLTVLAYLGGVDVIPGPGVVARFLATLGAGNHTFTRPNPPKLREAGEHDRLVALLGRHQRAS
jgi:hypothetical protein